MNKQKPVTTSTVKESKGQQALTMLTAYDYTMAQIFDLAGIDMLLVGDSLGNIVLGYSSTLPVTMEDMIHHTRAVVKGTQRALVVADMPFMSYQVSIEQGMINAGRLMKEGGASAVKLEGGGEVAPLVRKLTASGIPVMGHLGLTPQSVHQLGGFKVQGKNLEDARQLIKDAQVLAEAGAFAIVLECVPHLLAAKLSQAIGIPTIGIGAGSGCDGQVLVYTDFLGLNTGFTPKFAKKYRQLHGEIIAATQEYISEVQNRTFPALEHTFAISDQVLDKLY